MGEDLKKNRKYLLFLVVIGLFFTSCYEDTEGCLDPYASNYDLSVDMDCEDCCTFPGVSVSILHRYDSSRLDQDSLYTNLIGQEYIIKEMDFYIRNVRLVLDDAQEISCIETINYPLLTGDSVEVEDNIYLINPDKGTVFSHSVDEISTGLDVFNHGLNSIQFEIGLLDLKAGLDLAAIDSTNILSTSASYMYDSLGLQYNMGRIQYARDTAALADVFEVFIFDELMIDLPNDVQASIVRGSEINFRIKLDYKILFDNIDLDNDSEEIIRQKWIVNIYDALEIII